MGKRPSKPPLPPGAVAKPRRKDKKKSAPQAPEIFQVGINEITLGVPPEVKIAVADVIMSFSLIEQALDGLIWDLTGLDYSDGRLLTNVDTSEKIMIARDLARRYGVDIVSDKPNTRTVWRHLELMSEARNKVAHGVWWMHQLKTPMASSYRIKGAIDQVVSEAFPIRRLSAIIDQNGRLKMAVDRMTVRAQALRGKQLPPRPPVMPIR